MTSTRTPWPYPVVNLEEKYESKQWASYVSWYFQQENKSKSRDIRKKQKENELDKQNRAARKAIKHEP
jgi:hypothetical protein